MGRPSAHCLVWVCGAAIMFAGCVTREIHDPDFAPSLIEIEWHPDPSGAAGFLFKVAAWGGTICSLEAERNGDLSHPSGMGSYFYSVNESFGHAGVTLRADDAAHVLDFNSAHVSGPAWSDLANAWYRGMAVQTVDNTSFMYLSAVFNAHVETTWTRLTCNGPDAWVKYYVADAIAPILSPSATGGFGLDVGDPQVTDVRVGLNWGDRWSVETQGDHVHLNLGEHPTPGLVGGRHVEGGVVVRTPEGEETFEFHTEETHVFEEWEGVPGRYEIEMERLAIGRAPPMGILIGFGLLAELGTPPPDGDPFIFAHYP